MIWSWRRLLITCAIGAVLCCFMLVVRRWASDIEGVFLGLVCGMAGNVLRQLAGWGEETPP